MSLERERDEWRAMVAVAAINAVLVAGLGAYAAVAAVWSLGEFAQDCLVHFAMGCVFAGTALLVRGMCPHLWHKLVVGVAMIALEAVVTVRLVG